MRLGELLVQRRLVAPDQLRAALEEQQSYGKRLGSNLIQLGFLDIDTLSRILGEQRGLPAAMQKHMAAIDKSVVTLFPARAVAAYKAVPLGYTRTTPPRLIVACVDPTAVPVDELASAAGCRVDLWVAPERLIERCLEKYFAAPRAQKYVEVDFGRPAADPQPTDRVSSVPRSSDLGSNPSSRPGGAPSRPVARGLSPPPPPPEAPPSKPVVSRPAVTGLTPPPPPPAPITPEPRAVGARSRPPAILEPPPMAPAAVPRELRLSEPELPPDSGWDAEEAVPSPPSSGPISAPPDALRPVIDQAEASRLLEMATSKERVGLVIADWLRSTFGCGLVLVVKNDMAVGWQGFFPDAEDLIEAVAVPLGKPSLLTPALDGRGAFCGVPNPEGAKANQLLWKLLRCPPPSEVIVCPVVIAKRTVNLIYAHSADDDPLTDTQFRQTQVLAGDAGAAYLRIIRRERAK